MLLYITVHRLVNIVYSSYTLMILRDTNVFISFAEDHYTIYGW